MRTLYDIIDNYSDLDKKVRVFQKVYDDNMLDVSIYENAISVRRFDGTKEVDLGPWNEREMFGLLLNVDNIRNLGKIVRMKVYAGLQEMKPILFDMTVDGKDATENVRYITCSECGLTDSVLFYSITVKDLLKQGLGDYEQVCACFLGEKTSEVVSVTPMTIEKLKFRFRPQKIKKDEPEEVKDPKMTVIEKNGDWVSGFYSDRLHDPMWFFFQFFDQL